MLALRARDTGALGRGQVVEVSLYDAFLPMLGSDLANYSARGDASGRSGNHWPGRTPNGCYRSSDDEWVMVDGVGDRLFRRLATATGHEEWLADPRFGSRADRSKQDAVLEGSIRAWVSDRTAADVVAVLEAHAVPVAIVAPIEEVAANPHVRAREGVLEIDDEVYRAVLAPGPTPHLSETPGDIRAAAPRAGAHNDYLYRELLRLTPQEIDELERAGAI